MNVRRSAAARRRADRAGAGDEGPGARAGSPHPLGETLPSLYRDDSLRAEPVRRAGRGAGADHRDAGLAACLPGPGDRAGRHARVAGRVDGHRAGRSPDPPSGNGSWCRSGVELLQWRGTARGVRAAVGALFDVTPEIIESGGAACVHRARVAAARVGADRTAGPARGERPGGVRRPAAGRAGGDGQARARAAPGGGVPERVDPRRNQARPWLPVVANPGNSGDRGVQLRLRLRMLLADPGGGAVIAGRLVQFDQQLPTEV